MKIPEALRFSRNEADVFVPDGTAPVTALARTTHLCIGAHQDDIEIMAYAAIAECRASPRLHFTGVVATDGAGSPRSGRFARMTDAEMRMVRRNEQRRAARLGRYNLQLQLAHTSSHTRRPGPSGPLARDLDSIFAATRPRIVYLHNPADSHDTHVALMLRCVEAMRRLPAARRPARVLGCEVWRGLDWLHPDDKVALDASSQPALARELLALFRSQVHGGKRYDLATLGRRAANATFGSPREVDAATAVTLAIDLTPLVRDVRSSVLDFTLERVDRLRRDVEKRLRRLGM